MTRTSLMRRCWPISTNWMGRIVGRYLGVLLTQLPPTAFAPPWITAADRSRGTSARRHGGRTDAVIDHRARRRRSMCCSAIRDVRRAAEHLMFQRFLDFLGRC